MEDERPLWRHTISEDVIRWLMKNHVTGITHHREQVSTDGTETWIVLHAASGSELRVDVTFLSSTGFWAFDPHFRELLRPTHYGERAIKDLEAIDAWEAKHHRERLEYERLKRKFEGKSNAKS